MVQPINVRAINQGLRRWPINSTTNLGAGGAVDAYLVNSLSPDTVADFAGVLNSGTEYYRVGGSETTFASMFTYGGSSLGVMTDSDGNLKWKPHNLIAYSDAFNSWTKLNAGDTLTANATTDPDGGATADLYVPDTASSGAHLLRTPWAAVVGVKYKQVVWAKPNGYDWLYFSNNFTSSDRVWFNVTTGAQGSTSGSPTNISITAAGNGWYKCEFTTAAAPSTTPNCQVSFVPSDNTSFFAGDGTSGGYVWGAHVYRSDLGGMVNNPDRGDSYVPTTTAAKYLSRRNNYRYNGSSYVKKGILLESEAATNLVTYSADYTNAYWTKFGTYTLAAGSNLLGLSSLRFTCTADGDTKFENNSIVTPASSGINYCVSYLFSYVSGDPWVFLTFTGVGITAGNAWFNTSTRAFSSIGAGVVNYGYEELDDGVLRVFISGTTVSTDAIGVRFEIADADGSSFGDAGSAFDIAHIQLEQGLVPTSIMPTSGTTFTRAAETLTIAGSNMAASTSAMSFQMQGEVNYADTNTGLEVRFLQWLADASNFIYHSMRTNTGTGQLLFQTNATGSTLQNAVSGANDLTPGPNEAYNYAARHTNDVTNLALDGTAATENTGPTALADLSATPCAIAQTYRGTIALFRQDDSDWTDTGLEEATT